DACQPLYVPLVPKRLPVTPVFQVADASALTLVAGIPTLHLVLQRVPSAGWLAVQWFAPDGREAVRTEMEGKGRRAYSCRRASMGSRRDALRAG
ncbi:MAG: hypothetical protein R3239_03915, partial [Thermodesulfobacteriota bacterium]|nr:hypothetical protein [Thermodesulfobacteriota bacterium]